MPHITSTSKYPVVVIGNDIHYPYNEMAAVEIQSFRKHFSISSSNVFSIQTKKPITREDLETTIPYGKTRLFQLFSLLKLLGKIKRKESKLIHYVGDGNLILNNILALFCLLTGRRFLLSPLGSIYLPRIAKNSFISLHHQKNAELVAAKNKKFTQNIEIIPPHSEFVPKQTTPPEEQRFLFCSVPYQVKNFQGKGLYFLLDCAKQCHEQNIAGTFTILNRYPYIAKELESLVESYNLDNVVIDHQIVDNMQEYISQFSLLIIPFAKGDNVQMPMSALEALALGIPVAIPSWILLSEYIKSYSAGVVFDDTAGFVSGLDELKNNGESLKEKALQCFIENFSEDKGIQRWRKLYDKLLDTQTGSSLA